MSKSIRYLLMMGACAITMGFNLYAKADEELSTGEARNNVQIRPLISIPATDLQGYTLVAPLPNEHQSGIVLKKDSVETTPLSTQPAIPNQTERSKKPLSPIVY